MVTLEPEIRTGLKILSSLARQCFYGSYVVGLKKTMQGQKEHGRGDVSEVTNVTMSLLGKTQM